MRSIKIIVAVTLSVLAIPVVTVAFAPLSLVKWLEQFPTDQFAVSGRLIEGTLTHKDGTVVSWNVSVGQSLVEQRLIADVVVVSGEEEATATVVVDDRELVLTNFVGSLDARIAGRMAPAGSPVCDGIVEVRVASFTFSQSATSGIGAISSEKLDCRVGGFIPVVLDKVTVTLEEQNDAHNGRITVTASDALLVETVHADVGLLRTTLYTAIKQVFPLFLSDTDLVMDTRYQVFR